MQKLVLGTFEDNKFEINCCIQSTDWLTAIQNSAVRPVPLRLPHTRSHWSTYSQHSDRSWLNAHTSKASADDPPTPHITCVLPLRILPLAVDNTHFNCCNVLGEICTNHDGSSWSCSHAFVAMIGAKRFSYFRPSDLDLLPCDL